MCKNCKSKPDYRRLRSAMCKESKEKLRDKEEQRWLLKGKQQGKECKHQGEQAGHIGY
jgi:hypothetical protein